MSDELVASLKSQLAQLKTENGALLTENVKRKQTNQDLRRQVASLTTSNTTLTAERDEFKTKAQSNPNELAAENAKLKGEVRQFKHTDGLKQLLYSDEVGLNKAVPLDRAIKLMDYVAESDEFDRAAALAKCKALKVSDPYLFQAGEATTQDDQTQVVPGFEHAVLNPAVQQMEAALGRGTGTPATGISKKPNEAQLQSPQGAAEWANAQRALANHR